MRDYSLVLDVQKEENVTEDVWFMQGDVGGEINFSLFDDGEVIDLTDCTLYGFFENRNKEVSQKTLEIVNAEEGKARVEITTSILAVVGNIKVELKLYKGDKVKTTFTPFTITSKKSINVDEAIESTKEIDVVQVMEDTNKKVTQLTGDLKTTLENVDEKITNLDKDTANKILELNNLINDNIESLNSEVREKIAEVLLNVENAISILEENVGESIEDLRAVIEELVEEVNNSIYEVVENVGEALSNTVEEVNNNLKLLDNAKADVIVSEDQPDLIGLRVGTIWIRPRIGEKDE